MLNCILQRYSDHILFFHFGLGQVCLSLGGHMPFTMLAIQNRPLINWIQVSLNRTGPARPFIQALQLVQSSFISC